MNNINNSLDIAGKLAEKLADLLFAIVTSPIWLPIALLTKTPAPVQPEPREQWFCYRCTKKYDKPLFDEAYDSRGHATGLYYCPDCR